MKEFFGSVFGIILAIVLVIGLVFGGGYLSLKYKQTFGVANANADRTIFESTKTYVGGMADDLAKYKYEFQRESDPVAKQAIVDLVVSRFADFDISDLNDNDLKEFLRDARKGNLNQEIGGEN